MNAQLRGGYPFSHLDRLFRDLAPVYAVAEPCRLELDLQPLAFLGPSALALLTATLHRLEHHGLFKAGTITLPRSPLTSNYLERMDVFAELNVSGHEESFKRKKPIGFRPCKHFTGDHDYPVVASDLTQALSERCTMDSMARGAIRICLDELAENVVHHADTPLGGFATAQGWKKNHEFEIAIVDLGVGIRASLTKNPRYAEINDDVTAVQTALQPRVTSTPERNAGIGLYFTELLLKDNGGELVIRSGEAAVSAGSRDEAERRGITFPGTLVALRARTDRPLDLGKIYRRLDAVHTRSTDD